MLAQILTQTTTTSSDDGSAVGGLIVIAVVIFLIYRHRKKKHNQSESPRASGLKSSHSAMRRKGTSQDPDWYEPHPPQGRPTRIWSNNSQRIEVVGEAYHGESYRQIFRNMPGFRSGAGAELRTELVLAPDPSNPFDSNAVGVWASQNLIGYLAREQARQFHHKIASLEPDGLLAVQGRLWSRDAGNAVYSRTYFDMPDLDMAETIGEPASPDSEIELPEGSKIQVIGEEHHMDTLSSIFTGQDGDRPLWVRLRTSIDFRPRSARERVDVFVGEERIGWLSDAQTKNMLPLVKLAEEQGKTAVARGVISGSVLKAEVVLYVAKASEVPYAWIQEHSGPPVLKKKRPEFMWDDED